MNKLELVNQIRAAADKASATAEEYSGVLGSAKAWIVENFGSNGLLAAYLLLAVLVILIVSKLAGLTFSALKYLVIPAVALAFLASLFLPYSFMHVLPVTVTVCSLVMLFKG
jgi:hypothetical protein